MKSGKGRLQENDAPDLSDLEPSVPQNNLLSSSSSLFGGSSSTSRASFRNLSSRQAEPLPSRGREAADSRESSGPISSAPDSSSQRTNSNSDSSSADPAQEPLMTQIKSQAEVLERLRIQIIQKLQASDDLLYENADQVLL